MRLWEEPFIHQSHIVKPYSVHLPGHRGVVFTDSEDVDEVAAQYNANKASAFEAYFAICSEDLDARKLSFLEFGKHYRFEKGRWIRRKQIPRGLAIITRIYPVSPRDPELFAIRLMASNIPGISNAIVLPF